MKKKVTMKKKIIRLLVSISFALFFLFPLPVLAQFIPPEDCGLALWAEIKEAPPVIRLKWKASQFPVTNYTLHRKEKDAQSWGTAIATLNYYTLLYEDTNVETGKTYEYKLTSSYGPTFNVGYSYLSAGIKVPAVEYRGKIVLLVEAEVANALQNELETFRKDLICDGWTVLRHNVSRKATPQEARQIILNEYYSDPGNVEAVFLLGHLPVFGSGSDYLGPDGHDNHTGKWPADAYYGYMGKNWTSNTISTIPGDGVSLQVGRVDFDDMPLFSKSATELLRQYLNKARRYRMGEMTARKDCVIDDFLRYYMLGAAEVAFRTYATLWGEKAEVDYYFLNSLSYTWGFFSGYGSPISVETLGDNVNTIEIARWTENTGVIFCQAAGSYYGKWDYQNNLMRAFLATPNYGLTCSWGGKPQGAFHHTALGETIGYSIRLTQNNDTLYYNRLGGSRLTHPALMGDPTLRMFPVRPASNLTLGSSGGKTVLYWNASDDKNVTDYYIYGAADENGPYERLAVTSQTTWTDPNYTAYYMVRARKLTETGSGSYYNLSQGVLAKNTVTVNIISGQSKKVNIYPNPAVNSFFVDYEGFYTIKLYDMSSKEVLTKSANGKTEIDISYLPIGVYGVSILSEAKVIETGKIVKR